MLRVNELHASESQQVVSIGINTQAGIGNLLQFWEGIAQLDALQTEVSSAYAVESRIIFCPTAV